MLTIEPEVYLIGRTEVNWDEVYRYLADIGIHPNNGWSRDFEVTDAENLIEFEGRQCYRSWASYDPNKPSSATNPNVGKVREGNDVYLANLLKSGHESVLEHVTLNFEILNCSRVFTAELCRHRAGVAISQESLRYVRLNELRYWIPEALQSNPEGVALFIETMDHLANVQTKLAKIYGIETLGFKAKKALTSAFRRVAPMGLATSIGWSANLRALRHIIQIRTSVHAEEEIRLVFDKVASICKSEYPNVFQDLTANNNGEWSKQHNGT